MALQIQLRRDTSSNWTSSNPTLAQGEIGIETNTGKFKIGTGSTAWNSLSYSTPELTATSPITYSNGTIGITQNLLTIAQSQVTNLTTDLAAKASTTYVDNGLATKQDVVSGVSSTEIGYLDGVTSSIQTQLDGKLSTSGNAVTATTATNLAGGAAGRIPYQSASGTTAFTTTGTAGQVLTSNGSSAPTWSAPAATGFSPFLLSGM